MDPQLLIADEPTTALDVSVHAHVFQLIQSLQKPVDFACLFITHDLAVIDVLADRIAVMHHGRIVKTGTRDENLRYPKHPYTQRLLATAPRSDRTARPPGAASRVAGCGDRRVVKPGACSSFCDEIGFRRRVCRKCELFVSLADCNAKPACIISQRARKTGALVSNIQIFCLLYENNS
ncbi:MULTISPECIES: hypothetical protein [Cryobacterium]|uniref:Uncharacterized protein n=1 Tax=Cryobacterium levicorallinum TaxID=995038 RepID=A0A1I3BFL3_9MICO|nr:MULTISPECIES: hypothetical protein [Cryobacterium]TFB82040.1 hypothetical protein E3O11_15330 [Cryobacterium levicorallinum]TFD57007.1 hypothetical protein E3T41_13415 [Cryobacterium sp. Hh38]GEP27971.1 hypothetical protein CLE01_25690 [Cryobacterium levicorallinum]SFH61077.1 hypothetical protein SAMN05216274_10991 [Cryobacterium levicorallinum]